MVIGNVIASSCSVYLLTFLVVRESIDLRRSPLDLLSKIDKTLQ